MKRIELELGTQYGDFICKEDLGIVNGSHQYLFECTKCHRTKPISTDLIRLGRGTDHMWCINSVGKVCPQFSYHYHNMRNRTNASIKNPRHSKYHAQGISSDSFPHLIDFYDAMYESFMEHVNKYGFENTTLDRIDNSKGYTPENCRWATYKEQAANRSNMHRIKGIDPQGFVHEFTNITEFAEQNGLQKSCISQCLHKKRNSHHGWTFDYID